MDTNDTSPVPGSPRPAIIEKELGRKIVAAFYEVYNREIRVEFVQDFAPGEAKTATEISMAAIVRQTELSEIRFERASPTNVAEAR